MRRALSVVAVLAGCGRIGFDASGAVGDATRDGAHGDGVSADTFVLLSCADVAATCGPVGTASCCGNSVVPGGMFYRSYDTASDNMFASMVNPATVSDFRLDTYEVTVGRFRQFVNAGLGTQAKPPPPGAGQRTLGGTPDQGGWDPAWNTQLAADTPALVAAIKCDSMYQAWTDATGAKENLPMNCLSWFDAVAFCASDGGFLPTEAEWNYAAAGGNEQRAYPWSNPPSSITNDCSYANYQNGAMYCVNNPDGAVNRVGSESPKGDGKWGQADLAGDDFEWTLDWYSAAYANPCADCADLVAGTNRVIRGGGFYDNPVSLRAAYRFPYPPSARYFDVGVRCARAP